MEKQTIIQTLEAQKKFYVKPNDSIIFVIDNPELENPIKQIFHEHLLNIVIVPTVERPGQDYELDPQLYQNMTIVWLITTLSVSHAKSTRGMIDAGLFLISNPGITDDWAEVLKPENSPICANRAANILKKIGGNVAGKVRITDQFGTDLVLSVPQGNWEEEVGQRKGFGTNGVFGELVTAPYAATGTYVIRPGDFLTNPINRVMNQITLTIRNNQVIGFNGEDDIPWERQTGSDLKNMLAQGQGALGYTLGEFAIQLNPVPYDIVQKSICAEKVAGGMHVAIGTNAVCVQQSCPELDKFPFGRYSAGVHVDCIVFNKTVQFQPEGQSDWIILIDKGKIQF